MRVTELRLREAVPLFRGTNTVVFYEAANNQPSGDWKMQAIAWGVRVERDLSIRGNKLKVSRVIPWGMIKFAEVVEK